MNKKDITTKNNFPSLLHLSFILQQVSDELLLEEVGIGLSQARIMSVLHPAVSHSQRIVASRLHQTEANVSRQLRDMKKQGLVAIAKNKKDGRQKDVTLTSKGHRQYQKAEKILINQQKNFLRLLSGSEVKAFERAAHNLSLQHHR